MKRRDRLAFILGGLLMGTVFGWHLKTWTVEQDQKERRQASCDQTFDLARQLIASYGDEPVGAQLYISDASAGQYNQSSEDDQSYIVLDPPSEADVEKIYRQSLQNLVEEYGRSCSRAKRARLRNELQQAFEEKDARKREEQRQ
ncbi:MAG: hypothetical protein AAGH90_06130 [Pseudomonadota bacterium]